MNKSYKNFCFYLFGSYLVNKDKYNDIDCLMVVDSENEINDAFEWINNFKNKKIHFTIYTNNEFYDRTNKFSINGRKKLLEINIDEFI